MATQTVTLRLVAENGQLVGTVRAARKEVDQLGVDADRAGVVAERGFHRASRSAGTMSQLLSQARQQVVALAASYGAIRSAQAIVRIADQYANLNGRLRLVTDGTEGLQRAQRELFAIAQSTSSAYSDIATLYARSAQNTEQLSASQEQLLRFTTLTAQAFKISGASTEEQSGAIRQLTQALASGVFRGEEFNSVAEQGPRILQALQTALGKTRGELRQMAEDGQLTSKLVLDALLSQAPAIEREFSQLPRTVGRALTELRNEIEQAVAQADVTPLVESIDELKETLNDPTVQQGLINLSGGMVKLTEWAARAAGAVADVGVSIGETAAIYSSNSNQAALDRYVNGLSVLRGLAQIGDFAADVGGALLPGSSRLTEGSPLTDLVDQQFADLNRSLRDTKAVAGGVAAAVAPIFESINRITGAANQLTPALTAAGNGLLIFRDGAPAVVEGSKQAQAAIDKLREQVALYGAVTNVEKARAAIAAGLYGAINAQQQAEILGLAQTLDAKQQQLKLDEERRRAAERLAEANQRLLESLRQDAQTPLDQYQARIAEINRGVALGLKPDEAGTLMRQAMDAYIGALHAGGEAATDEAQRIAERIREALVLEARDYAISFGLELDEFDVQNLADQFDLLNDIPQMFEGIGDAGEQAIERITKAAKAFAVAGKASGEQAFGAYLEGAALSLQSVQGFTRAGSQEFERLGIVIQGLQVAQGILAVINAMSTGDPYTALARAAAVAAAVASLGVSVGGSFAGGSSSAATTSTGNANLGTGSVLGDATARSESIARSIEHLEALEEDGLNVARSMLITLRSIDAGVRNAAAGIARNVYLTGSVTGARVGGLGSDPVLDQDSLTAQLFGSHRGLLDVIGDYIGQEIGGVVGSLLTSLPNLDLAGNLVRELLGNIGDFRQIKDTGLLISTAQTLADAITNGLLASFYTTIREGENDIFGGDHNVRIRDVLTPLTDGLQTSFDQIVQGIGETALDAAVRLGVVRDQALAALADVSFADLGIDRISFDQLSGEELEEAIAAVFSTIGDRVAETILPSIIEFQRNGEGAYQTLLRVATQTAYAQQAFDALGISLETWTGATQFMIQTFERDGERFAVAFANYVMRPLSELETAEVVQRLTDLAGGSWT
jgi:tape measure domain-containing protein